MTQRTTVPATCPDFLAAVDAADLAATMAMAQVAAYYQAQALRAQRAAAYRAGIRTADRRMTKSEARAVRNARQLGLA